MRRLVPFLFLAVALAAPRAHAVARAWNGSVNIQWNVANNWTPAGVPTAADDVTINVAGTVRISSTAVNADAVAASLTIGAAVTLDRRNGHILIVTNGITVNSASDVSIQVPFTAASLSKSGAGNLTLNGTALSGTTPQVATVNVTGGTLTLAGGNALTTSGLVSVSGGATLARTGGGDVNAGGGVTVNGGSMTFANAGGLSSSGPVTLTSGSMSFAAGGGLSSTGAVSLTSSTVTFAGAGGLTATGASVTVGTGSTLSTTANASVSAGSVDINGGAVSFGGNGDLTATGAVTVSNGGSLSFGGNGDVTAQSFSLASGSSFTVNFATGANPTNIILSGGNGTLGGTINITGTPNATSFNLLTGAGAVNITGLTLGTAPTGFAFGFRPAGTSTVVLDVTVNPIAPDGTASATGSCPGPLTWQHTISATANDRYLLVGVSTGSAAVTPTAVTFGAQMMSSVASRVNGTSGAFIYGLLAPARGTATITVTLPAGPCSVVAGSLSFTGVDQTTPIGTAATAAGTGTSASTSPSTVQGDKVISVLGSTGATTATPQAGATVRWSAIQGSLLGAGDTASRTGAGTFNVTMSWTLAPSSEFALAALPIHAAIPTRVMGVAASVRRSGSAMAVSVRSGSGSDLVGFRVWRESAGRRELLTPGLVEGPALTSQAALVAGSEHGWVDARPVPGSDYLIEGLHLDGRTTWSRAAPAAGPAPSVASALLGAPASAVLVDQPSLRIGAAGPVSRGSALVVQGVQWQLAAGAAVKVTVSTAGVVRVPAEALFAAGVPVGAAASSIQLFRAGRRVPRTVVAADGVTLRGGDAVEFYGYPMETRYSGSAVYWLTAGQGTGLEISSSGAPGQGAALASFLASAEIRERLTWFGAARNGDAEKFFGPAVFSTARQRVIPLDALDVSGAGARLEIAFQGLTEVSHAVAVSVNGLPVGSVTFAGATPGSAVIPLPPGTLVVGDNTVALVAPATGDVSLEHYVRIVYPRFTTRGSGALEFTLPGGTATRLDGFDPALTRVLDITDPDAPVHLATWSESGAAAVVAPGTDSRRLLAYLPMDAAAPVSVVANRPSNWHAADGADLVIVGSASLLPEVQSLVDARRAQGLSVALVDVEDVQDEFASGEKSADALRAFVQQAEQAWIRPPRYLLLLGSASFDPRDYLGLGADLVPSGTVQTDSQLGPLEAASDSWFLGVQGAVGLSIGRLPARTADEARTVVAKILGRREADSKAKVLLVSDRMSTSDFPEMTSDLQAVLPDAQATVLLRGTDPDPAKQQALDALAHQQFLDALHANPALVNFAGHAAETFWTDGTPSLYSVDDVAALAGSQPGLWVDMTCLTAFFQDPRRHSLAVATLLAPEGGAWGAWGSTAMTSPGDHPALDRALVRALLLEGKTLGEATREALAGTSDSDVQSTFVLLGDPSARAVSTAALQVAPKPSASSGCSATPAGSGTLLLLAIGLWFAAARRRVRVAVPRE